MTLTLIAVVRLLALTIMHNKCAAVMFFFFLLFLISLAGDNIHKGDERRDEALLELLDWLRRFVASAVLGLMARLHLRIRGRIRAGRKLVLELGGEINLSLSEKSGSVRDPRPDFPPAASRFRHPAPKSTFRPRGSARDSASVNPP
ncbi:unnamed protein product [Ixodes pacificus]